MRTLLASLILAGLLISPSVLAHNNHHRQYSDQGHDYRNNHRPHKYKHHRLRDRQLRHVFRHHDRNRYRYGDSFGIFYISPHRGFTYRDEHRRYLHNRNFHYHGSNRCYSRH